MKRKPRLLLVDDEADLLAELAPLLEHSGYQVATATNGQVAITMAEHTRPDLIILDVLLPRLDGREVLRHLRQSNNWTPVILLTQIGTAAERALSLQEGADDYVNKPFDPVELIARIQAVLRRTRQETPSLASFRKLASGDLTLDRQTRQAWLAGNMLPLTARGFGVLEYLMLNPNEVIARERLLGDVWGWDIPIETRAVDMRIAELRRNLDDDAEEPRFIKTVVGHGYCFVGQVEGLP